MGESAAAIVVRASGCGFRSLMRTVWRCPVPRCPGDEHEDDFVLIASFSDALAVTCHGDGGSESHDYACDVWPYAAVGW
jgi:hypothetical protein